MLLYPGLLAIAIGIFAFRKAPGAIRKIAFVISGLLSAYCIFICLIVLFGTIVGMAWREFVKISDHPVKLSHERIVLSAPKTIDGLDLPAGTTVDETTPGGLELNPPVMASANLPAPTRLLGVLIKGTITPVGSDDSNQWGTTLADDEIIGWWPCQAGYIQLSRRPPLLRRCVLSKEMTIRAPRNPGQPVADPLLLPAGTDVQWTYSYANDGTGPQEWWLSLPDGKTFNAGGIDTSTNKVVLYPNSAIVSVGEFAQSPTVVRGIPFDGGVDLVYPEQLTDGSQGPTTAAIAVYGRLAGGVRCGNLTYGVPKGTAEYARIPWNATTIAFSSSGARDAKYTSPVPIAECATIPQ